MTVEPTSTGEGRTKGGREMEAGERQTGAEPIRSTIARCLGSERVQGVAAARERERERERAREGGGGGQPGMGSGSSAERSVSGPSVR